MVPSVSVTSRDTGSVERRPGGAPTFAYVVDHDPDRLAVLGAHVNTLWKGEPPAQTLLGVAALALPGMLFEVDALTVSP